MEIVLAISIGVLTGSGVFLLLRPRTFQVIMRRAASPGGLPILRPAKSFGPLMPEDLSQ